MNKKSVLITGGLGFVGSNLARKFCADGCKVTILDCLDPNSGGRLFNIKDIESAVTLLPYDILDFDRLCESVIAHDIIINCAASTSHPYSMREPWLNLDVNSRGVINILEAIRRFNSKAKFIHLGTTTQLGPLQQEKADELHPEFPTDIYSANKMVSEKYVLIYAKAYKMDACVLRLSNIYGPRAAIHSPDFTFNNYFIGLALQNKTIPIYGEGLQTRNIIFIDDVVEAIHRATNQDNLQGECCFIVSDNNIALKDIAESIVSAFGTGNVSHVEWPNSRKAIEFGSAVVSGEKFSKLTGWRNSTSLKEGLLKTLSYYNNCLEEYLK